MEGSTVGSGASGDGVCAAWPMQLLHLLRFLFLLLLRCCILAWLALLQLWPVVPRVLLQSLLQKDARVRVLRVAHTSWFWIACWFH